MGKRTLPSMEDRDWRFSRAIKAIRAAKGMSQQDLAGKASLSIGSMVKYETAASQPTWPVVLRIAGAMEVEVAEIIRLGNAPEGS